MRPRHPAIDARSRGAARRIILHAGLPKTGTTTIQDVFYQHRAMLLEHGVLYPGLAPNLTTPLCTMFLRDPSLHISNRIEGDSAAVLHSRAEDFRAALEEEIRSVAWHTLVLSAEGVSNLHRESLQGLRSWMGQFAEDWMVLFCLRDPLSYTRSVIQQLMKGGDRLEELYRNLPLPNMRGKIGNAIAVFGRDRVEVFAMRDAIHGPGGLVGHFADVLGFSEPARQRLVADSVVANESMSHEAVLVLDSLNRKFPMFPADGSPRKRSGRELGCVLRIRGSRYELPEEVRHRVINDSADDVAWVASEFGVDLALGDAEAAAHDGGRALRPDTADSLAELISSLTLSHTH